MKLLLIFFCTFIFGPTFASAGTIKFSFNGPTEFQVGETGTFDFSFYDVVFDKDRMAQPQGTPLPETQFRYSNVTVTSWDGSQTLLKNSQGGNLSGAIFDYNDTPENGSILSNSFDIQFTQAGVYDVSISVGARFWSNVGSTDRGSVCCVGSNTIWSNETLQITVNDISAVPLPAGGLLLLTAFGGVAALKRRKKRAA